MIQKQTDSATVRGPPGPTIIIYKELIRVQQQQQQHNNKQLRTLNKQQTANNKQPQTTNNDKQQQQQSFHPRATPFFFDNELTSVTASSPTLWGEMIL